MNPELPSPGSYIPSWKFCSPSKRKSVRGAGARGWDIRGLSKCEQCSGARMLRGWNLYVQKEGGWRIKGKGNLKKG